MANRMYFISRPEISGYFEECYCDFEYSNGFALSQKQKCIKSMHESIFDNNSTLKVLEISTKSTEPLGVSLSAFNLELYNEESESYILLENIFQSSKVFEKGGPYLDLLLVSPKEAKRDTRLANSGKLIQFKYNGRTWPIEPKTMFYDWIYIVALNNKKDLSESIMQFDTFTDIEFNHKKSINCQARAAAIYVSLKKSGHMEEYIKDLEKFVRIYIKDFETEQISLF